MVKDKRKKDAPTATETPSNPNSTTGNSNTLYRKSQVDRTREQGTLRLLFIQNRHRLIGLISWISFMWLPSSVRCMTKTQIQAENLRNRIIMFC